MRWTFLMDAYVVQQGKDAAQDMSELITHMEQNGWHEGLPRGRSAARRDPPGNNCGDADIFLITLWCQWYTSPPSNCSAIDTIRS